LNFVCTGARVFQASIGVGEREGKEQNFGWSREDLMDQKAS